MFSRLNRFERGEVAEALIDYIFTASGRTVFPIGIERRNEGFFKRFMEKIRPGIPQSRYDYHPGVRKLVSIPDFAIEKNGDRFDLVEVKYRYRFPKEGEVKRKFYDDIERIISCWSADIVVITKKPYPFHGHITVFYRNGNGNHSGISCTNILKRYALNKSAVRQCEHFIKTVL